MLQNTKKHFLPEKTSLCFFTTTVFQPQASGKKNCMTGFYLCLLSTRPENMVIAKGKWHRSVTNQKSYEK